MAIVIGTVGPDELEGVLDEHNIIQGLDRNDIITGGHLHDEIDGGSGSDVINALGGDDVIRSGLDDDRIDAGPGDDTILLNFGLAGQGFTDSKRVFAGPGDDVVEPSPFADVIDGGPGQDRLEFASSSDGVAVQLARGTGRRGHADGDVYRSIEDVVGTGSGDSLIGNGRFNEIFGRGGDDVIAGGAGGDLLVGGAGRDRLHYRASDRGVEIDLDRDLAAGGDAQGDQIDGFEDVFGSDFDDRLRGDDGRNRLEGFGGADRINGRGGADALDGGRGDDRLSGGGDADMLAGGAGADRFVFTRTGQSTAEPEERDTIVDFSRAEGDRIVLRGIDADTQSSGNQAFQFIGSSQLFTGTNGELRYVPLSSGVGVLADVNGDLIADFTLFLEDATAVFADDFVL